MGVGGRAGGRRWLGATPWAVRWQGLPPTAPPPALLQATPWAVRWPRWPPWRLHGPTPRARSPPTPWAARGWVGVSALVWVLGVWWRVDVRGAATALPGCVATTCGRAPSGRCLCCPTAHTAPPSSGLRPLTRPPAPSTHPHTHTQWPFLQVGNAAFADEYNAAVADTWAIINGEVRSGGGWVGARWGRVGGDRCKSVRAWVGGRARWCPRAAGGWLHAVELGSGQTEWIDLSGQ